MNLEIGIWECTRKRKMKKNKKKKKKKVVGYYYNGYKDKLEILYEDTR